MEVSVRSRVTIGIMTICCEGVLRVGLVDTDGGDLYRWCKLECAEKAGPAKNSRDRSLTIQFPSCVLYSYEITPLAICLCTGSYRVVASGPERRLLVTCGGTCSRGSSAALWIEYIVSNDEKKMRGHSAPYCDVMKCKLSHLYNLTYFPALVSISRLSLRTHCEFVARAGYPVRGFENRSVSRAQTVSGVALYAAPGKVHWDRRPQ